MPPKLPVFTCSFVFQIGSRKISWLKMVERLIFSIFSYIFPLPYLQKNPNKPYFQHHMAVCQNLVPLVNIKIAGKWMFIPLKMVLIGIDPYPHSAPPPVSPRWVLPSHPSPLWPFQSHDASRGAVACSLGPAGILYHQTGSNPWRSRDTKIIKNLWMWIKIWLGIDPQNYIATQKG